MKRLFAIFLAISLGVGGAALPASSSVNPNVLQYQAHGPSDGEFSAWTKLLENGNQVKFYVKYPQIGQKIQFMVQQDGSDYKQIAWMRLSEDSLGPDGSYSDLQNFIYFIRSVDLKPGKNRFKVLVDGKQIGSTKTYTPGPMFETPVFSSEIPWFRGVSNFTWSDGRELLQVVVEEPEGCDNYDYRKFNCVAEIHDANGKLLSRFPIWGYKGIQPIEIPLDEPWADILARGPLAITHGVVSSPGVDGSLMVIGSDSLGPDVLKGKQCNPLEHRLSSSEGNQRQAIMNDIVNRGLSIHSGETLDTLSSGVELEGVTQRVVETQVKYGKPIESDWQDGALPESGLTREITDGRYKLVTLDCANLVSATVQDFLPFQWGVDGFVLYFHDFGYPVHNQWVTVNGTKYQTERGGRIVNSADGKVKDCASIRNEFGSKGYFSCYVPRAAGSYSLTVTRQYIGSGNLLLECRSSVYRWSCSTSVDRSVLSSVSAKFKIDKSGYMEGPSWWPYNFR